MTKLRINLAGVADRHSKKSVDLWGEALARFARVHGSQRTPEQIRSLIERIESTPPSSTLPQPAHIHAAERRLGKEKMQALVERCESGLPARLVAAEFDVALSTVLRLVRRRGGEVRTHGKVTAEIVNKAGQLYGEGLSVQRIATRLDVPKSSLLRAMKDSGMVLRPPKH